MDKRKAIVGAIGKRGARGSDLADSLPLRDPAPKWHFAFENTLNSKAVMDGRLARCRGRERGEILDPLSACGIHLRGERAS